MADSIFVFPEEEESPEVKEAKLRIQKTLKRNREREKEVLQPLPVSEKILLNESLPDGNRQNQNIQNGNTNRNSNIYEKKKTENSTHISISDSINNERRKKKRKVKSEATQEKKQDVSVTDLGIASVSYDNHSKHVANKTDKPFKAVEHSRVKRSSIENISLMDQLSKHLETSSNKNINDSNTIQEETKCKLNDSADNNKESLIQLVESVEDIVKDSVKESVRKKLKTETDIDKIEMNKLKDIKNNKAVTNSLPRNELKEEKSQEMGGINETITFVENTVEEDKNKQKSEEEIGERKMKPKNKGKLNKNVPNEMNNITEEDKKEDKKEDLNTNINHSSETKIFDVILNSKEDFEANKHEMDKKNMKNKMDMYNTKENVNNNIYIHKNNENKTEENIVSRNVNKKRNATSTSITIDSKGSNSPITISSITSSSSDSSEPNYLIQNKKEEENFKNKKQRINDYRSTDVNNTQRNHTNTNTNTNNNKYNHGKETKLLDIDQLQCMIEKHKNSQKGNSEMEKKKLIKNLKRHYTSLNKNEKLYYCYMMKKLKIKYDKKKKVFYNNGMFISNFSKTMNNGYKDFGDLGYLEYSIYYFLKWLTPTEEEKLIKLKALMKLETLVKSIFTKSRMEVFGSFVTGLSIPGGDVDVCFMNIEEEELNALYIIAYALVKLKICHSFNILIHAQVKILRYIDKELGVRFDVCINQKSSKETTDFMTMQVKKYAFLRPLVLLVKFFLNTRQLNETYVGGIGSFLLSCMVLHFLQMHESSYNEQAFHSSTLTILLLKFFNFYNFEYKLKEKCAILRGMGHIIPIHFRKDLQENEERLCFENPINTDLNIGIKSFKIKFILYVFSYGFCTLVSLLNRLKTDNYPMKNVNSRNKRGKHKRGSTDYDVHSLKDDDDDDNDDDITDSESEVSNNDSFIHCKKKETNIEGKKEKQKNDNEYIENSHLNYTALYPLFYGHFFNPNHIIFTKRIKQDFENVPWNGEQCSYNYSKDIKEKMFRMVCSYFQNILSEDDKSEDINYRLFNEFTKIFASTLNVKSNIFKQF